MHHYRRRRAGRRAEQQAGGGRRAGPACCGVLRSVRQEAGVALCCAVHSRLLLGLLAAGGERGRGSLPTLRGGSAAAAAEADHVLSSSVPRVCRQAGTKLVACAWT